MEYKDYYKTLGVDKNASEKEIKTAIASWHANITLT